MDLYIYIDIIRKPKNLSSHYRVVVLSGSRQNSNRVMRTVVILTQGEGHKVWGNAPKKSNSATCAHFHKRARCTSKRNVFLIFRNFWGVKIVIFHDFCQKVSSKFLKFL